MGGCRLLYFSKQKMPLNARILLIYCVFISIATFILLYFLRLQEGGL